MKRILVLLALCLMIVAFISTGICVADIHLRSGTISTSKQPQVQSTEVYDKNGSGYYIVELVGPVEEADKQALINSGARIVDYLPDNAFVICIQHRRASTLRKLPCVRWVGKLKPEHKLSPRLLEADGPSQYIVELFPGHQPGLLQSKARLLGARNVRSALGERSRCHVLADRRQVEALAGSEGVAWIEPYVQPRLCNDAATVICGIDDIRQGLGIYGLNQLIGVADCGLDTGNLNTLSADFAGRVEKVYTLRRPGEWSDLNGHGTHVVGTLLGSGVLSGSNPGARDYYGSFAGYAPLARLVFQSIGDDGSYVFPPLHLSELFQPAYDDGVRVHSNSWGSATLGQYTVYSNEVDQFCWDHKDFLPVFAVGNDALDLNQDGVVDADSIYAPATAKNCIAAGATENLRGFGGYQMGYGELWQASYPVPPIKYDPISNNPNGMAAFSGRGPTDDGRIKPDLCAPGTNVISCRTHAVAGASGWAAYDNNYCYWGGTSMSTPQIAGSAVLVREYYTTEKNSNPSAALVKAILINGAQDISPGQYGTGLQQEIKAAPDRSQGWGRLDVKQALFPDHPTVNDFIDESSGITTGEYREYQYTVANSTVPLKATLVWTDYPGAVHAAKELVNDLDLTITTPNGTTFPTIGSADRVNNVEQVKIPNPQPGTYKIRVSGYNVPMGPQDYSLVVSGGLPITYIAGRVVSSSGAPVQGVQVTLSSAGGEKRVTTNSSGRYLAHVVPGSYLVQVSKPGWTFTPPTRNITVTTAPVENVFFQGSGMPGTASGNISSAIGGIVNHVVESPHPYLNNMDQIYTITAHEGATRVRVHFAEIDLMMDGDNIQVLNAAGAVQSTYTGRGEDIWSPWVSGRTIKIRIRSNDYGNVGYGFYIDGYETDLIDQGGLEGAVVMLNPGGYQTSTGVGGEWSISSVPPGTYTATPSKAHWKFQPTSKVIEIPSGDTIAGVDFLAFPPGSIAGQVRASSSEQHSVNVQSAHPYPLNYENTWQITGNANATRIRLHFERISVEPGFDFVYIMDGEDNIIEIYTADNYDLWTPWIPGNVARIMLTSDTEVDGWGFKCDGYEVDILGQGLPGVRIDLGPDGRSTYTGPDGTFRIDNVDVGSHTVTPVMDSWSFDPPVVQVSVAPAMEENLFFFASAGQMTRVSQVKTLMDGAQVTLSGVQVSAKFNGFFYVQDSDRSSGLRVVSGANVSVGSTVTISGTLETVDGERRIVASGVTAN